jgi:hypothetical protein
MLDPRTVYNEKGIHKKNFSSELAWSDNNVVGLKF